MVKKHRLQEEEEGKKNKKKYFKTLQKKV